jgi:hypothetical protein
MPDIKNLCRGFCEKYLNPKNLKYREKVFSTIDEHCNAMIETLKHEIYFGHPNACDCLLDYHKIAAVYILTILKNQPFIKESNTLTTEDDYFDVLPNEHYCSLLLQVILLEWHKSNGKTISVKIPTSYKDCLLLWFRKYRKSRSPKTDDITFAYALANIIYLIDTHFVLDINNHKNQ